MALVLQHNIAGEVNMAVANILQSLMNIGKDHMVYYTKILNNDSNPGAVDLFMDSASGRGHRIVIGHDLSYLPSIYDKFGINGVFDYFKHIGRDIMSPDGIPIPFAKELKSIFDLSMIDSINWLCLNIGDLISGAFSIWHTNEVIHMLNSGKFSNDFFISTFVGSSIKIYFSISSVNPISLVCGIIDLGVLSYYVYSAFKESFLSYQRHEDYLKEIFIKIQAIGFLSNNEIVLSDTFQNNQLKKIEKIRLNSNNFSKSLSSFFTKIKLKRYSREERYIKNSEFIISPHLIPS